MPDHTFSSAAIIAPRVRRGRLARASRLALALFALGAAACENSLAPGVSYQIRVLDAGAASDTVLSMATRPLSVEVDDRNGRPEVGVVVKFLALAADSADSLKGARGMYVCAVQTTPCARYYSEQGYSVNLALWQRTDSAGRALAHVQFGVIAGPAAIGVSLQDSAGPVERVKYTTRPGAFARVVATVPDTAVYVGRTYDLGAHAADRFGNARPEPVTLADATPTVIHVTSSGQVTASGTGRGRVRMRSGDITDSAWVSVPPHGRLAAFGWAPDLSTVNQLVLINTDGSKPLLLGTTPGISGIALPVWTPDGNALVFDAAGSSGNAQLNIIDMSGAQRALLHAPGDFSASLEPAFSSAGWALYFFGTEDSAGQSGVFRANADGSGSTFMFPGVQPAPSPDGSLVAYVSDTLLMVRDMASGQATAVAANPVLPRWSPKGDLIAFVSYTGFSEVRVVRADGSGLRTIASGDHDRDVSWSPDGEWLVTARWGGGLEIIRVADGERLPIPGTSRLMQPTWRPAQ